MVLPPRNKMNPRPRLDSIWLSALVRPSWTKGGRQVEHNVNDYTHYALIGIGHSVFGVGKTPAEARDDARHKLVYPDRADETVPLNSAQAGDLAIVHCTGELAERVRSSGGDILYEHDGIDYIRLPENDWKVAPAPTIAD